MIQKFVMLLGPPDLRADRHHFLDACLQRLGSFFSRKIRSRQRRAAAARPDRIVAVLVAVLAFAAPVVSNAGIVWPLPLKMLVTAADDRAAAFAMGMPFPSGSTRLEKLHPASVRWAWALNAASSVLGSASAIFLAI